MQADAQLQGGIAALWALVGAARAGDQPLMLAAAEVVVALLAAPGAELVLRDEGAQGAGLWVNGRPLVFGVSTFAAAHGLLELLRRRAAGALVFAAGASVAELCAWARRWSEPSPAGTVEALPPSIRVELANSDAAAERHESGTIVGDSRLGSMFLQHRLMSHVDPCGPVPPVVAKAVLQAIVDRLLAIPGGLEPLMLLQQDGDLLRRSTNVAVLAVLFARVGGWPDAALADIGVAALLHDIGVRLDVDQPGNAGSSWLLMRGCDDLWLRAAVVARCWRAPTDAAVSDAGADQLPIVALVRIAERVEQARRAGSGTGELRASLVAAAAADEVPEEFVALALEALDASAER